MGLLIIASFLINSCVYQGPVGARARSNGEAQSVLDRDVTKPVVTLISPIDQVDNMVELSANTPITFTCSATDDKHLSKIVFWLTGPGTNGFNIDQTKQIIGRGRSDTATFTKTFNTPGNYAWNCQAYDRKGNYAFGDINSLSPGFKII